MYTIIGGDGKEYGPVPADQVRAWVAAGRANLESQAKAQGTNEWKRLGDFPDFGGSGAEPPPMVAARPRHEPASRGARLGAALIDNILSSLCATPLLIAAYNEMVSRSDYSLSFSDLIKLVEGAGITLLGWLVLVLVQIWLLSAHGQSIGKRLLGLRIVRFSQEGNPGFSHAVFLRSVVPMLIGFIPYFGFVFAVTDVFYIFRADRRCLHDLIADTVVVKATPAGAAATPAPSL